jgi:DNA primase
VPVPNLVELIGASVPLKRIARMRFAGLCPFHSEKTPSFHVYDSGRKWRYHCHGCGAGGDIVDWLMKTRGLTYRQASATAGMPVAPDPVIVAARTERKRREAAINAYRNTHPHCCIPDWLLAV